jgi:hypothetical protein
MKNIFYCPQCKKLDINFAFNHKKHKVTWSNPRDGYGRPITHIICPNCGYELSGFVNTIGQVKQKEDESEIIEYYKSVIEGYSDGSFCDSEKLLELIRNRMMN